MTASSDHPYPPLEIARPPFFEAWQDPLEVYEEQGADTYRTLGGLLPDDWSFEGKRVLDFGCGAGRTLRHFLDEAESGEFWGSDIHAEGIEWLQQTLCPPLHAMKNLSHPPLGLEYGSFDLAWAISVFSHLADNSLAWIHELHRLLKPGGLFIATYLGPLHSEFVTEEPWDEDRVGMNVLQHNFDWETRGGPTVLISDWWLREHWGRAFEVLKTGTTLHKQSVALMRKRDVDLTVEDLEKPGDDPREFAALRHNLHQVQREYDRQLAWGRQVAAREQEAALSEARREYEDALSKYEHSVSWRATYPLRAMAATYRSLRSQ